MGLLCASLFKSFSHDLYTIDTQASEEALIIKSLLKGLVWAYCVSLVKVALR